MRQGIEKKREPKSPKAEFTVMFHDSQSVLGRFEAVRARECAAPSRPLPLVVISDAVSDASSQPRLLPLSYQTPSPDRTRSRSLSHTEKFSAEEPMAPSAFAVFPANPNTRSVKAASTVFTTMTEQRRC